MDWVFGVEGDWSLIDNSPSYHPNLFTLRGRAGWTHENMLFYVTAGGGTKNSSASIGVSNGGPPQIVQTISQQTIGPVAGGGVEMKLPYHLSARAEGLYYYEKGTYNFSAFTLNSFAFPAAVLNATSQHFIDRASLIYNFN